MTLVAILISISIGLAIILYNKRSNKFSQQTNLSYTYNIVGENSYQNNLSSIAGKKGFESKFFECRAHVISEPFNKFDSNAVKVEINGLIVGYLSKLEAQKLKGHIVNKKVPAVINGGWYIDPDDEGSYGVKLAISNVMDLI